MAMFTLRYSLATLLAAIGLAAFHCAVAASLWRARLQTQARQAIGVLEENDVEFVYAPLEDLGDEDVYEETIGGPFDESRRLTGLRLDFPVLSSCGLYSGKIERTEIRQVFDSLADLPPLESLVVQNWSARRSDDVSEASGLRALQLLRDITLPDERFLEYLNPNCPLERLRLFECRQLTDGEIQQLALFRSLEEVGELRVNDYGLAKLVAAMPKLKRLWLRGPRLSGGGLRVLTAHGALQDLELHDVCLTCAEKRALEKIPTLRSLRLCDCTLLDEDRDAREASARR